MMDYILLSETSNYSKNPHPVLYHFLGKFFGLADLGFYFIAYAYAKWVDDQIDSDTISKDASITLLDRQFSILLLNANPNSIPEKMAAFIGEEFPVKLKSCFLQLMKTFYLDVERRWTIQTNDELERRVSLVGNSYISFCREIFAPNEGMPAELLRYSHLAYIKLDMLLDIEEDLKIGYCNVPKEYIESHSTDHMHIFRDDYRVWKKLIVPYMKESISEIEDCFKKAELIIPKIKSMTFKIFLRKMLKQRYKKLNKLKVQWNLE